MRLTGPRRWNGDEGRVDKVEKKRSTARPSSTWTRPGQAPDKAEKNRARGSEERVIGVAVLGAAAAAAAAAACFS